MPWLEKRGEKYRVKFRYAGRNHQVALGTADPGRAERDLARLEENLLLLERGRLELPDGADVGRFLLSDGKAAPWLARSYTGYCRSAHDTAYPNAAPGGSPRRAASIRSRWSSILRLAICHRGVTSACRSASRGF